jgi:hypothetical protein
LFINGIVKQILKCSTEMFAALPEQHLILQNAAVLKWDHLHVDTCESVEWERWLFLTFNALGLM